MAKGKILSNRKVFQQALDNVSWKLDTVTTYAANLPDLQEIDTRNLNDLACLLIDVDGLEGEERTNYFLREVEKIKNALYTLDPLTGRPYPDALRPYMRALYETVAKDINIDWNDQKQIENVLATMKASQSLATFANDFKDVAFSLYPTQEQVKLLDAYESKAYVIYNNMRLALDKAGIDISQQFAIGAGCYDFPMFGIQRDLWGAMNDAIINGNGNVTLDPFSTDLFTKFLFGENLDTIYHEGIIYEGEDMREEKPYNQDDYLKHFLEIFSKTYANTTFEQMLVCCVRDDTMQKYNGYDLVHINGKSVQEIIEEKMSQGLDENTAELEGAKALRDALTDGKSVVSLMRITFNKEGKVDFYHQELNVDLDKLNEADRQAHHGFFRNLFHKIGIWKIPERYTSNKERDKNQEQLKADPEYANKIKRSEDKFIETYNSLEKPESKNKHILWTIPSIKKESDAPARESDNAKNNPDSQRHPVEIMDFRRENTVKVEPPKQYEQKVLDQNSFTK